METKFTPGPWSVDECGCVTHWVGNNKHVLCHSFVLKDGEYPHETARLIAAAPEMYELLEQLIPGEGQNMNDVNKYALRDAWEELRARINA